MLLLGLIILSVFSGIAQTQQDMVAFVSFVVQHSFTTHSNGVTDMTVTAAFTPHPMSNTISGSNLWRLGFFGSQNSDGTGPRANQIYQLLSDEQASMTAYPGQNLTFVASSRVNLNGIGPDQRFPYYCTEFAKSPRARPNFVFQVANDVKPAILCRSSQNLPRPRQQSNVPRALFSSMMTTFQISKSRDDSLPSRSIINVTLQPHEQTDTIRGNNLWRLGFFGSRDLQGSGERKNESPQLLLPFQARQPLLPAKPLVFTVERLLNMADIGRDEEFPYLCVEFTKQPSASPDFLFQGTEEPGSIVLCQSSRNTGPLIPTEATDPLPLTPPPPENPVPVADLAEGRVVEILTTNVIAAEASREKAILVAVNFPSSEDMTISFATGGGDRVTVTDVVIPAGQLVGEAEVTIIDDEVPDPRGTTDVIVKLTPSRYYNVGQRSTATMTILDDDTDPILIGFTSSDVIVKEDAGDVTINLSLNKINEEDLTINFRIRETDPASAQDGVDFIGETTSYTVPAGMRLASVTAIVLDDDERERSETFVVEIDESTLPANVEVVGETYMTIHIQDSDGCPDEYFNVEDMCFRKEEELLDFDEAREACQQSGADLASASTPHKNTIVSGVANGDRCWVGAVVHGEEYTWLNGDPWEFTHWRKREPNWNRKPMRACIETNFVRPTLWNDHFCRSKRPSVCAVPVVPEP